MELLQRHVSVWHKIKRLKIVQDRKGKLNLSCKNKVKKDEDQVLSKLALLCMYCSKKKIDEYTEDGCMIKKWPAEHVLEVPVFSFTMCCSMKS